MSAPDDSGIAFRFIITLLLPRFAFYGRIKAGTWRADSTAGPLSQVSLREHAAIHFCRSSATRALPLYQLQHADQLPGLFKRLLPASNGSARGVLLVKNAVSGSKNRMYTIVSGEASSSRSMVGVFCNIIYRVIHVTRTYLV